MLSRPLLRRWGTAFVAALTDDDARYLYFAGAAFMACGIVMVIVQIVIGFVSMGGWVVGLWTGDSYYCPACVDWKWPWELDWTPAPWHREFWETVGNE